MHAPLHSLLVPDDGHHHSYAVIDGASCEALLEKLDELRPEHVCLYAGKIEPDVAETAPYLVHLEPGAEFTGWVIDEGWGNHWGIFVHSAADLRALRKHFRSLLLVRDPAGHTLYFRYYDPRVFLVYLPTCNAHELATVFGPVQSYEIEEGDKLVSFSVDGKGLHRKTTDLKRLK